MGKVEIGIYFCVTAEILKKKFYINVSGVVLLQPYEFCVKITDIDWLPCQSKGKIFEKKIVKTLLLKSH